MLAIFFLGAFLFYSLYGIASRIIGDDPTHLARIVRPLAEDRESFKAFWHSKERSIRRFGKMNGIFCFLAFAGGVVATCFSKEAKAVGLLN